MRDAEAVDAAVVDGVEVDVLTAVADAVSDGVGVLERVKDQVGAGKQPAYRSSLHRPASRRPSKSQQSQQMEKEGFVAHVAQYHPADGVAVADGV